MDGFENLRTTLTNTNNHLNSNKDHSLTETDGTTKPGCSHYSLRKKQQPPGMNIIIRRWKEPFPPSSGYFYALVQYIETESYGVKPESETDSFIWIMDIQYSNPLRKLLKEINRSVETDEPMPIDDIQIGSLAAVPYQDTLFRAEILSINFQTRCANVHFIDYGFRTPIPFEQMYKPIPIMKNLKAYIIRAKLPKSECPNEDDNIIRVRVLDKCSLEGYYTVERQEF